MSAGTPCRALLAALCLLGAAPAGAQAAAMLPEVGGAPEVPAATTQRVEDAVAAVLEESGYRVLRGRRVLRRLARRLRACTAGQRCMADVAERLRVDLLVGLAVFGAEESPASPTAVAVTVVADGLSYPGRADVTDEDVAGAGVRALNRALSRAQLGPGPYLEVTGSPVGAVVELDDGQSGDLPYLFRVGAGALEVEVRLPGYETHRSEVIVPDDPTHEARLVVALTPEAVPEVEPQASDPQETEAPVAREEASPLNWVVAGGLAAASVAPFAVGFATLGGGGTCLERIGDTCVRAEVGDDALAGLWIGVGAALLTAAVVWAIVQPIRVSVTVAPTAASLRLQW
jgi:hypothetical protein